jgi:DNA invertase Pin-like site-specific DNA recombinase
MAMVAEFEADLIRLRTREGMRVAKAKGRLRGKQPKLNARQEALLASLHRAGEHSVTELGDLFGVGRSTVYRAIQRDAAHLTTRRSATRLPERTHRTASPERPHVGRSPRPSAAVLSAAGAP